MEARNLALKNIAYRGLQRWNDYGLWGLTKMDMGSKNVVWLASYAEKVEKITKKPYDMYSGDFSNKEAVLYADDVVETTIGSMDINRMPKNIRTPFGKA